MGGLLGPLLPVLPLPPLDELLGYRGTCTNCSTQSYLGFLLLTVGPIRWECPGCQAKQYVPGTFSILDDLVGG